MDNKWREAVDEALVGSGLDCIGPAETPKQALDRLIEWLLQIALDPAVSSEAAKLAERRRWPPCAFEPDPKNHFWCLRCQYHKYNPRHPMGDEQEGST